MSIHEDLAKVMEWSAVLLNIGFTILIGLERRSGWVLGFIASVIGIVLYAVENAWLMSALNGFYAAMAVYGWLHWGADEKEKRIVRFRASTHAVLIGTGILATFALLALMKGLDVPGRHQGMESFISAFAMVATWLMGRKALENWFYWTIGDVVAVIYNHLIGYEGYALLNAVYIVLAVLGFLRWRKQMVAAQA